MGRVETGTDDAFLPFWSPDSRHVGFFTEGKLKRAALETGAVRVICDTIEGRGATWNASDTIVFAQSNGGPLMRVSAEGGDPQPITTLDAARNQKAHRFPWFLPDGRHFLFVTLPARAGKFDIFAGSVDGPDIKFLTAAGTAAIYAEPGYLVFLSRNGVAAQRFDARRLELSGEPITIGDVPGEVGSSYTGGRAVSASETGELAYLSSASPNTKLAWLDGLSGTELGVVGVPPGRYEQVRIAPDGRHAAVVRRVSGTEADIWIVDLERGGATRFTNGRHVSNELIWSPDGTRIAFGSDRSGPAEFFVKSATGAAAEQPLLLSGSMFRFLNDWSPDGRFVISDPRTNQDLWMMPVDGSSPATPYLQTPANEMFATFSPDGRWVAYLSDESGASELYVQSFPAPDQKYRVTTDGAMAGRWMPDGRILFLRDRQLFIVDVDAGPSFHVGTPRAIATLPKDLVHRDSLRDRSKILALRPVDDLVPASLTVVLNWTAALRKR